MIKGSDGNGFFGAPLIHGPKDVLMGIPKSDLLGITMAVMQIAGQRFLAV